MNRLGNVINNLVSGFITFCFGILIVTVGIMFIEWLGK